MFFIPFRMLPVPRLHFTRYLSIPLYSILYCSFPIPPFIHFDLRIPCENSYSPFPLFVRLVLKPFPSS